MIATCTNCASKFRVDDSKLGPRGAKVKCSRCGSTFIVRPEVSADTAERAGEAPVPAFMPPEPTPTAIRELPLEFTPMPGPAPHAESSIPAATALAPPLPGPRPPEASRFNLPPPAPRPMANDLTPPPMPRALPKPVLPAAPPPPPPFESSGAAFDEGVMELDSANDFETTSPGFEAMAPSFEATSPSFEAPTEPLDLDTGPESPPASDSLLDLAGPGFAPASSGAARTQERTKPTDVTSLRAEAPPSAQDLFDASFASPLAPPPISDEPTRPMPAPSAEAPNPLAGMPSFDEPSDFPLGEFAGGMSQEGIVTKNVDVRELREQLKSQTIAAIALDRPELRDAIAENLVEPPARAPRRGGAMVIVASGLVVLCALALLASYFAGGWQGLHDAKPATQSLAVEELRVIPYSTRDGSRFWIVRGRVKNRTHLEQTTRVEVTGGGSSASAELGLQLDPLALYSRGDVAFVGTPLASLAAGASADFTVALSAGAVPDANELKAQAVPR